MDTIIEFNNVSFSYPGNTPDTNRHKVLNNINLKFKTGELVAIMGHNGSGKSTLAKMTNGLYLPTEGCVLVNGVDTTNENRLLDIRQTVGLVFQNPDNQIVATVVEEDIAFALENLGVPPDEIRTRVDFALHTVGMYDYREHAPHRLSGGQKQRVAIAGILAMNPAVLVLDEPTAMLDPQGRREVLDTVFKLCSEQGVTILMITHHMSEAALCRRAIVLDSGRICMDDTPEKVFIQHEKMNKLGLTLPQVTQLAQAAGVSDSAPLTVDACANAIYKRFYATKNS